MMCEIVRVIGAASKGLEKSLGGGEAAVGASPSGVVAVSASLTLRQGGQQRMQNRAPVVVVTEWETSQQ